jgi:glycosyltransferase involved in cell wall biosynthesis
VILAQELSVVVAVKDEAHQIRECLEQLRFARELIVVDMGSTDGTRDIAREIADRVIEHDGGPHRLIHVNKNAGFDAAAGPWILNLDADERLTPALRDEIVAAIAASPPGVAAYALPFTHYFFGKYLRHGGFRGSLIRLFRKGKLRYPEDRAHSTPRVDGEVRELKGLVVHFNHRTVADFVRKMNTYTSSDAALLLEHGRGGLRNRPLPASLLRGMVQGPLSVFWNRYVRHAGFRDGTHGFVAAALMAYYQFVEYAKAWELRHVEGKAPGKGA